MTILTKDECLGALNEVAKRLDDSSCGGCICGVSDCMDCEKAQGAIKLEQLINEHFELKEKQKRLIENCIHLLDGYKRLEIIFETATSWEEAQERYLKE